MTDRTTYIDFVNAEDLQPGDVVRTCDMARIAELDSVPPAETITVELLYLALSAQGYVTIRPKEEEQLLIVRKGRLVPIDRQAVPGQTCPSCGSISKGAVLSPCSWLSGHHEWHDS